MSATDIAVVLVDDLLHLVPLDRLLTLIGGDNFDPRLREEPITFDIHDPIYGYSCAIRGCAQHSTPQHSTQGHMVVRRARAGMPGRSAQRFRRGTLESHSRSIPQQTARGG